jgi:hypothetical protein
MKPLKTILLGLVLVLVPALATVQAKTKKPDTLPAVFNHATYVYVEATGGQEFDARLNPNDRQAITDVREALYVWKRYVVTAKREQADLIFVVRTGRLAEARVGVQVGPGGQGIPNRPANGPTAGNGVSGGGEVGPPDDLLEVYVPNPNDARGVLVWRGMLADGLSAPELTLFKQLKDQVESTYPTQTASKASKP